MVLLLRLVAVLVLAVMVVGVLLLLAVLAVLVVHLLPQVGVELLPAAVAPVPVPVVPAKAGVAATTQTDRPASPAIPVAATSPAAIPATADHRPARARNELAENTGK